MRAEAIDLVSRLLFMLKMHKAISHHRHGMHRSCCAHPGTVAWDVLREEAKTGMAMNIGHPGGIISVEAEAENKNGEIIMKRIGVYRTARRIMDGYVYVRK